MLQVQNNNNNNNYGTSVHKGMRSDDCSLTLTIKIGNSNEQSLYRQMGYYLLGLHRSCPQTTDWATK